MPEVVQGDDNPPHTPLWVSELNFTEVPDQSYSIGINEISQARGRIYSKRLQEKRRCTAEAEY